MNTTANKITMVRVVLIPVFLVLCYLDHRIAATVVFIIASLSDLLDGYIAEKGQMPGWVVAVVLFREFAVSGLRLIAAERQHVIAAAWSGKIKTTCTMIGLCFVLVFTQFEWLNIFVSAVILITTVYSGVEYFWKNKDVFRDAD